MDHKSKTSLASSLPKWQAKHPEMTPLQYLHHALCLCQVSADLPPSSIFINRWTNCIQHPELRDIINQSLEEVE